MLDTKQLTSFELYILKEALINYRGAPVVREYLEAEQELRDVIKKEWNERMLGSMIKNK